MAMSGHGKIAEGRHGEDARGHHEGRMREVTPTEQDVIAKDHETEAKRRIKARDGEPQYSSDHLVAHADEFKLLDDNEVPLQVFTQPGLYDSIQASLDGGLVRVDEVQTGSRSGSQTAETGSAGKAPRASRGEGMSTAAKIGIGIGSALVGIAAIGGATVGGIAFKRLHDADAITGSRDQDGEDVFVPDVHAQNNALGTVTVIAITAADRPDLKLESAHLIDPKGKMVKSMTADDIGGAFAEGTWDIAGTNAEVKVIFTPADPTSPRPPLPVKYMVRSLNKVASHPGSIMVTYNMKSDDDETIGLRAFKLKLMRGPVTINLAEVLENFDASTLLLHTDGQEPAATLAFEEKGSWSFDAAGKVLSFALKEGYDGNPPSITYTLALPKGGRTEPAKIEVIYLENQLPDDTPMEGPIVRDVQIEEYSYVEGGVDLGVAGQFKGVEIDVLDSATVMEHKIDRSSIVLLAMLVPPSVDPPGTRRIGEVTDGADGRLVGFKTIEIANQGSWHVTPAGTIGFVPVADFAEPPLSVLFAVADTQGNRSNPAMIALEPDLAEVTILTKALEAQSDETFWESFEKTVSDPAANLGRHVIYSVTEILELNLFRTFGPEELALARKLRPHVLPDEGFLAPWHLKGDSAHLLELAHAYVDGRSDIPKGSLIARYLKLNLMKRAWRIYFSALEDYMMRHGREG